MNIKLIAFNGRYIHSCLALFYVREELRRRLPEASVELRQFTINDPYYPTLLKISEAAPEVVMFSLYIWNGELILRLLHDLARILPETRFVLGGPQIAALNQAELPPRTTLVAGPVEGLPESFYADLGNDGPAPYYRGEGGRPFPSPYLIEDLTGELRNRHLYYESSRGCPFACSYCLSSVERGVTWKETKLVKEELRNLLAQRPKLLKFVDRTFNAKPERALEIWRFLAEEGGETVCHFEMAPDLFTEEMFEFLVDLPPGRFQFELGIQSTNPDTLRTVNRVMDLGKVGVNIHRLAALGNIHLHADLILGLPGDGAESCRRSLSQVFAMGPHHIQMGLLKVLPETVIRATPGLVSTQHPPYEVLATADLDHPTLSRLFWLGECVEAFYNNRYFPTFFAYLRRSGDEIATFFDSLLELCQSRDFFSRAATQELLTFLLAELVGSRTDGRLLLEILRYDWLRCGHRFLPPGLGESDLAKCPGELARRLPPNLEPLFDYRSRGEFLKRHAFSRFSAEALTIFGWEAPAEGGIVAFLAEREESLHRHQKTILLPE
jgi:radical SAM superfamily enzyme YgiQ (UPF0313 family)